MEADFKRQNLDPRSYAIVKIAVKWSGDVLTEGFTPFPKKMLRVMGELFPDNPSIEELAALLAIADFKREGATRSPSFDYLAFLAGMELEDFKGAIERMVAREWITYERVDDARSKEGYEFDTSPLMKKICELAPPEEESDESPF